MGGCWARRCRALELRVVQGALIAAALGCPALVHAEDVCEAFTRHGVYDTRAETSDTDKAASFRLWFCQSNFESKKAADSVASSMGFDGVALGFDEKRETWRQFSSNYCRDESYALKYRNSTVSFVQTINETVSKNMLACFLRGGLHARVIPGARPDTFYVQARMNPTGTVASASVTHFDVVGANCQGPITAGYNISAAGVEVLCQRHALEGVDITLSASEQVNWDSPRGLGPIAPQIPAPIKQQILIRAQDFVRGTNVAIDKCVEGPGTLANAPNCKQPKANAAEFDFVANAGGTYRMEANFTAAQSRPVKVVLNGKTIRDQALSETTGSWLNSNLRWFAVGEVVLGEGANTVRLERPGVFPHIHDLRFVPVDGAAQ